MEKSSKTAVVLLVGVTISGTSCPRHFTVPFGAEAPSDHVVQAFFFKKNDFLYGLVSPNFCARRRVVMISNLSESLAKPLVMAKLNMANLSSLKNQQNCCRPIAGVTISGIPCPRHFTVPFGADALSDQVVQAFFFRKNEFLAWSRIYEFLRPAQCCVDFKLIRITCQTACHGKTEHGIFVN